MTNEQEARILEAIGEASGGLPEVSSEDEGKVLVVGSDGKWELGEGGGGGSNLPDLPDDDEGQFCLYNDYGYASWSKNAVYSQEDNFDISYSSSQTYSRVRRLKTPIAWCCDFTVTPKTTLSELVIPLTGMKPINGTKFSLVEIFSEWQADEPVESLCVTSQSIITGNAYTFEASHTYYVNVITFIFSTY